MGACTFWNFSLTFYALPGVPEACLTLQDEGGADVNVVLYLLFLADRGRLLDAAAIDRIESISIAWREAVVAPLRGVRRRLQTAVGEFEPSQTAALRTDVKRIELAAERLQQEALERLVPASTLGIPASDRNSCARNNLALYARRVPTLPATAVELIQNRFAQP